MSDLLGTFQPPFAPGVGPSLPYAAKIGAVYRWAYLYNDSPYDALYATTEQSPPNVTNYQTWDGTIPPGHGTAVYLPPQGTVPANWTRTGGPFTGTIWLAVLDYNQTDAPPAGLLGVTDVVQSGFIAEQAQPARQGVWITGYYDWEGPPLHNATLPFSSQYYQKRDVEIPYSETEWFHTNWVPVTGTILVLGTIPLTPRNILNATAILYASFLSVAPNGGGAFNGALAFSMVARGHVHTATSVTWHRGGIWQSSTNNTSTPYVATFHQPWAIVFPNNIAADETGIDIGIVSPFNTALIDAAVNVAVTLDGVNTQPIAGPGNVNNFATNNSGYY